MFSRLHACLIVLAMICFAATGVAEAAGRHRQSIRAADVGELKAEVAAAEPTARAEVATAASHGQATLGALVNQVIAMPLAAPDTTTPDQYALLTALQPYSHVEVQDGSTVDPLFHSPFRRVRAYTADTCWYNGSHIWSIVKWYIGPVYIGNVEKDHNFWCGNGSSITQNGLPGYYHKGPTAAPPYCQVTIDMTNAWDAPNNSWAHGEILTHIGEFTPWTSCVTWDAMDPVVRIAANGYWDTYNDF